MAPELGIAHGSRIRDCHFWTFIGFVTFVTNGVAMRDLDMMLPGNCISRRCESFLRVTQMLYKKVWKHIQFLEKDIPFFQNTFLEQVAAIAKGPGPGLGPAFTHSSTRLLGFHQMTRVSSED